MPSAKQIKARKAFVKKYAKKGKSKYAKNIGELKKGKKLNPKSQKKVDNALANLYRKSQGRFGKPKRMTNNELEQKELENLNRNIPQFEMVNMGKQSQKILDSMKKRRDILSKKY